MLPDLVHPLPQQLETRPHDSRRHPRHEQLYDGTSWIRQYLRRIPVLIICLPLRRIPQRPRIHTPSTASSRPNTSTCAAARSVRLIAPVDAAGRPLTPVPVLICSPSCCAPSPPRGLGVELEPRAHTLSVLLLRRPRRLGTLRPHAPTRRRSRPSPGRPYDHLITRVPCSAHEEPASQRIVKSGGLTDEAIASFTSIIDSSPFSPCTAEVDADSPRPFFDVPPCVPDPRTTCRSRARIARTVAGRAQ